MGWDSRGMGEVFAVGDRIEWWSDIDGGPAEPGDPGAKKHTGTVASVHRNPNDDRPCAQISTGPPRRRPRRAASAHCCQTARSGLVLLTCAGGRFPGQEVGGQRQRLRDRRDRRRRTGTHRADWRNRPGIRFVSVLVATAAADPRRGHRTRALSPGIAARAAGFGARSAVARRCGPAGYASGPESSVRRPRGVVAG